MFENLSFADFTFRREPVLYLALAAALLMLIGDALTGDIAASTAIQSAVSLVVGFFARGQVSPAR